MTLRERDNTQLSLVAKFHNLYTSANKEVQKYRRILATYTDASQRTGIRCWIWALPDAHPDKDSYEQTYLRQKEKAAAAAAVAAADAAVAAGGKVWINGG